MAWGQLWSYSADLVKHDSDEDHSTVYYGKGKVKSRLQDRLNKKECPLASYYRIEYLKSEAAAIAREEELLKEYKTAQGRLPMYNERIG